MASRRKYQNSDLLDGFSPEKITKIVPTTQKKVDVFEKFRPDIEKVIDYNISETCLKCRFKGTELNVKVTKAEYEPKSEKDIKALERKRQPVYSHVGPPQWKFVDEVWMERQDKLQKVHKDRFVKLHKNNKKNFKRGDRSTHKKVQRLAGPSWYQELSPKQIYTIDCLKYCIKLDLDNNTTDYTFGSMAMLGLVPRPNRKKIKLALKYCCGYPVEFLLIMFNLLEMSRTKYSLNDRLLLSGVVHLTIRETLKELHKRIPSPPRECKCVRNVGYKIRKFHCKVTSPYLEPYTFKPEPRRFTGLYYDKHVQYPESPYFSYLYTLYQQFENAEDLSQIDLETLTDGEEKDLIEETVLAQKIYQKTHNFDNAVLLKPTIIKHCKEFDVYKKKLIEGPTHSKILQLPPLATLKETVEPICECLEDFVDATQCCRDVYKCECDECKCRRKTKEFIATLCAKCNKQAQAATAENLICGVAVAKCNVTVPIIGGTYLLPRCDCMETYKNRLKVIAQQDVMKCMHVKYVNGGLVMTKIGPVYCVSTALLNSRIRKLISKQSQYIQDKEEDKAVNKIKKQKSGKKDKKPCVCTDSEQTETERCYKVESKIKNAAVNTETRKCNCCTCQDQNSASQSSSSTSEFHCRCMEELENILNHKLTCDYCKSQKDKPTFIINDTTEQPEADKPINVISGVHEQYCDCLGKHLEKLKRLDDYKKRVEARCRLKKQIQKYKIEGVSTTPLGPVYNIAGVKEPVKCVCFETQEDERLAEEMKRRMPKPLETRARYGIAGVAQGDDQNIFILQQTLLQDKCSCERLYEDFTAFHSQCVYTYENYLSYVAEQKELYAEDLNIDFDKVDSDSDIEKIDSDQCYNDQESSDEEERTCSVNEEMKEDFVDRDIPHYCTCIEIGSESEGSETEESVVFDPCYQIHFDPDEFKPKVSKHKNKEVKTNDKDLQSTKRFLILKMFPKKSRSFLKFLKKALKGLAEDGFPLAQIPEVYKLPHFKLWSELRIGKKWTRKDRDKYIPFSKTMWDHSSNCYNPVSLPDASIIVKKAKTLTWTTANYWRDCMEKEKFQYYSKFKQCLIDNSREFFPGTFSYEFPTPGFRKCFFAYIGGKEEDLCPYLTS